MFFYHLHCAPHAQRSTSPTSFKRCALHLLDTTNGTPITRAAVDSNRWVRPNPHAHFLARRVPAPARVGNHSLLFCSPRINRARLARAGSLDSSDSVACAFARIRLLNNRIETIPYGNPYRCYLPENSAHAGFTPNIWAILSTVTSPSGSVMKCLPFAVTTLPRGLPRIRKGDHLQPTRHTGIQSPPPLLVRCFLCQISSSTLHLTCWEARIIC